jgi:hypothetical protein
VITLRARDVLVGEVAVDVFASDAVSRLRELLGPQDLRRPVGVFGSGRTGHWLASGVLLVSQLDETDLVSMFVFFDPTAAPYLDVAVPTAGFRGEVVVMDRSFRGGEREDDVWTLPGAQGFASMPSVRDGELFVGFVLPRSIGKFGKRTGARRLAQISAEWGGPKPFPGKQSRVMLPE